MISITNIKDIPSLNPSFQLSNDFLAEINTILVTEFSITTPSNLLSLIFSLLDITSLEGTDYHLSINQLCDKILALENIKGVPSPAAICVYPTFIELVASRLKNTSIRSACVAGGFPSGQTAIEVKVHEVKWAIEQGTTEIDVVISRGKLIAGNYQEVFDELIAIREAAKGVTLKIIIESGELQTTKNIRIASDIALYAGADFIKTSTGKITEGATFSAAYIMLQAIKDFYHATGKKVGLKPAGGISDVATAINYLNLTEKIVGESWLNNQHIRFGASRLANNVLNELAIQLKEPQLSNYF